MDLPGDEPGPRPPDPPASWQERLRERGAPGTGTGGAEEARNRLRLEVERTRAQMEQMVSEVSGEPAKGHDPSTSELDSRARLLQDLISRADTATSRLNQAISRADLVVERTRTATIEAEARLSMLLDALLIDLREIGDQLERG